MRLDSFTPALLEAGLKGIIGKGGRGPAVREALKKHKAVYFLAVGGTGALVSLRIKKVDIGGIKKEITETILDYPAEEESDSGVLIGAG